MVSVMAKKTTIKDRLTDADAELDRLSRLAHPPAEVRVLRAHQEILREMADGSAVPIKTVKAAKGRKAPARKSDAPATVPRSPKE